jgi:hypothetical protein
MAESINTRFSKSSLDTMSKRELKAAVGAILDALQAVAAKLDADATVTDTNYAAVVTAIVTD